MTRAFIDTNVVLYLVSADAAKADRAETLLKDGPAASVQLLAELTNVCLRKFRMTWPAITDLRTVIEQACVIHDLTHAIHRRATMIAEADGLSIYDAQVVAAALAHDAPILWSEDLRDGRRFEGRLTVRNPFRSAAPPL